MKRNNSFWGTIMVFFIPLFSMLCAAEPLTDPPQQREIKITARRFEFSPKTITVRKGEHVRLVVTAEDVDHGFALKEFDIDQEIKAKQTKVIEFTPNREGRFQFSCSVFCGDGHNDMAGELIVTEAPIESASTLRVSFDQTTPGVVIVESAGERLRIELGVGYHLLDEAGRSPIALSAYASVEGGDNFTERYTYTSRL